MNELKIFKNTEFGQVRTAEENGNILFCGSDVAKALGYAIPHKAINDHCKGILKRNILTNGGNQEMLFIAEGDVYRLIIKSKLPSAEKFESWVFDEVLPTIRKTGGYVNNDELFINTYLPFADDSTKLLFKATLETVRIQNEQIKIMKPKSDYFDNLVERNLLTNIRDTAKELKIKQSIFTKWLEDKKYIYYTNRRKIRPYSDYTPSLFELKEFTSPNGYADAQALITPRGRETFRLLLIKDGLIKEAA